MTCLLAGDSDLNHLSPRQKNIAFYTKNETVEFPFPSRNLQWMDDGRPREALVVTPLSPRKRSFHERNEHRLGTLVCESCTEISAGVGIGLDHEHTKLQRPLSLHSAMCAAFLVEPARDPSPNNKLVIQPYHPISPPCGYVPCESNAISAPDCIADLSFAGCAAAKEPAKETLSNKKAKVTALEVTEMSLSMSPATAKQAEAIFAAESLLKSVGILSAYNYKQERELMTVIAEHLAPRLEDQVSQVASFTFPIISMQGLVETLGQPSQETREGYIWKLETPASIRASLSRTFSKFSKELKVHGLSKPLQKPSDNYVRMIATLLPTIEIHVESDGFSMDRLWVNMMNLLIDDAGEMHLPKDRRELVMDKALTDEIMATAHADLRAMHAAGVILSPNFLRQIGEEEAARELERAATATQVKQVMK